MKVSVALAYYNGGKYIDEQLRSILSQLDKEDELVLSVDGAGDGSGEKLKDWAKKDRRIRLIRGPGRGPVRNFAHALASCSGDIIFLSDQDDIWEAGKVTRVMDCFEEADCLLVLHNAALADQEGQPTGEPDLFRIRKSRTGLLKNFMRNSYVGCCMAFRRELLPLVLPVPERMYMHDYWIGTAAELCGKVVLVKDPLIRYRRHGGNVTEMTHGSLGFMIKKRLDILYCLLILIKRRRRVWKKNVRRDL